MDTGSSVSIISQSFYKQHLQDLDILPITEILNIECASGQMLPYSGYIEAELKTGNGIPNLHEQQALFLIAPDTKFFFKHTTDHWDKYTSGIE